MIGGPYDANWYLIVADSLEQARERLNQSFPCSEDTRAKQCINRSKYETTTYEGFWDYAPPEVDHPLDDHVPLVLSFGTG